ncbi:MAG: DUF1127 domain-containing protein [Geminicoccaceae bacterium]
MATHLRVAGSSRPGVRHGRGLVQRLARSLDRAITTLMAWREVARQRRALLALNDHLLKDIGLSRADALREMRRPFWDQDLPS